MSTPSRSKDLYAAVDSRRASPLMNAIDRELRRVHRIATAEGMVGDDDLAEVIRALGIDAGTSLIDLGCGSASPSGAIASETRCPVVAIDINVARLARIDRALPIEPLCADLNNGIPLRGATFHAATQFDSIVHVESKDRHLADLRTLLRPGGRLALTSSTNASLDDDWRRRLGDVPGTIWRLSTDALVATITGAGFTVETVRSRREQVRGWQESRRDALLASRAELLSEMSAAHHRHALDRSTSVATLLRERQLDMVLVVAVRTD